MKQFKTLLGIIFYDQTVTVCEVESSRGSYAVRSSAQYTLPKGITLETVSSDAAGFKAFLKDNGFRSHHAIVGLSANHMISTLIELPRIENPQMRHDTIKINLERKLELDFEDIVFDYDDRQGMEEGRVLVMMLLKKKLLEVQQLLRSVKITPVQITNTTLGLNLSTGSGVCCYVVEYPTSFELCMLKEGRLLALQSIAKDSQTSLDTELARKITRQINRICLSTGIADPVHYSISVLSDQSSSTVSELKTIFGQADFKTLESLPECPLAGFAGELAGRRLSADPAYLNFLNGHHSEQKQTAVAHWIRKAILPAAVVLLVIGFFVSGWYSDQKQIIEYEQQLESMQTNVQEAEAMIDQVAYARRWFQQTPQHLEILRELTLSFPENSTIWLTSLAIDGALNQILTGRAVSEEAVLDVVESLQGRHLFDDVKILYIRKMGKGTDILTFAINLQYQKEISDGTD